MKEIRCYFPSHDQAQQAAHHLRSHGFTLAGERIDRPTPRRAPSPVVPAGQNLGFSSQPFPDGFWLLPARNEAFPDRPCHLSFLCLDDEARVIHGQLLSMGGSEARVLSPGE